MNEPIAVQEATIQVLYFHSTYRCVTCNTVEDITKDFIQTRYNNLLQNGTLSFKSINIDEKENKSIVEQYQILYSTLLIVNADGTFSDITNQAFQYATTNQELFVNILENEIEKLL